MATETLQLARRGFDALGEGGVEAMPEYVHPDFEMETLRRSPPSRRSTAVARAIATLSDELLVSLEFLLPDQEP